MNITWIKRHSTIINIVAMTGQVLLGSLMYFANLGIPNWGVATLAVLCNVAILLGQRTKQGDV